MKPRRSRFFLLNYSKALSMIEIDNHSFGKLVFELNAVISKAKFEVLFEYFIYFL
jgi:hypothetical protein